MRAHQPPAIVLGSAQMRVVLQRRAVKGLLLVSGVFVLVYLAILYLETMQREGALGFLHDLPLLRLDARTMQTFLARQRLLHYLLCVAAGAEVIALDRRHRALQIYLARPLRVFDYLAGKALPLVVLLSLISLGSGAPPTPHQECNDGQSAMVSKRAASAGGDGGGSSGRRGGC